MDDKKENPYPFRQRFERYRRETVDQPKGIRPLSISYTPIASSG